MLADAGTLLAGQWPRAAGPITPLISLPGSLVDPWMTSWCRRQSISIAGDGDYISQARDGGSDVPVLACRGELDVVRARCAFGPRTRNQSTARRRRARTPELRAGLGPPGSAAARPPRPHRRRLSLGARSRGRRRPSSATLA